MAHSFKRHFSIPSRRDGYRRTFQRQDSDSLTNLTSSADPTHSSPTATYDAVASSDGASVPPQLANEGRSIADTAERHSTRGSGLGISLEELPSPQRSYQQSVPTDCRSPPTPGSADPLISSFSSSHHSREASLTNGSNIFSIPEDQRLPKAFGGHESMAVSSSHPPDSSPELGRNGQILSSPYQGGQCDCRSRRDIVHPRHHWLYMSVLGLSIFSTVLSGIYCAVALKGPGYGTIIRTNGAIALSTATFITALLAKMIELSFVTVFVAFLGQILSGRAFMRKSGGVTLAELTMRSWILQPGTLITHYESVRYAALTFLGMVTLTAAILSMFYTTAADALVAPQLRYEDPELRTMYGRVSAQFASVQYIQSQCATPIRLKREKDPAPGKNYNNNDATGATCLQIHEAGTSFQNYAIYLTNWTAIVGSQPGIGRGDLQSRPRPPAMLANNTSVLGSWIDVQGLNHTSSRFRRRVHNVTMAMPHAGVISAAQDTINKILQPQDLAGVGEYQIEASVPSPVVNVICAGMTRAELAPFVYELWDHGNVTYENVTRAYRNRSVVDGIFGLGVRHGWRPLPTFKKLPIQHNTLLNASMWGQDSIYVLGRAPNSTTIPGLPELTHPYELCSMRSWLTPKCSTRYRSSNGGGSLRAHCEDDKDAMAYHRSAPDAPSGLSENFWMNLASEWANNMALKAGADDGNSSNARAWTRMIPMTSEGRYRLDPDLPSSAEALAVMAGSTLLLASRYGPFTHHKWDREEILPEPELQQFRAIVRSQQYGSGGVYDWQKMFHLVLVLVFLTNVFCLVYLFGSRVQVTDFTEPQNLFSLSINSPPSHHLAGSCGGGPEKDEYAVSWFINVNPGEEHVYIHDGKEEAEHDHLRRRTSPTVRSEARVPESPLLKSYSKLSSKRQSLW